MSPSPTNKALVHLLFCSLLLLVLVESGNCHKDDDDDDYDDDDPGCYPGRNCKPGCYCGAESECRPYNYPTSQHAKWKCRPFNYPKWKVYRKGEKYDGGNATIIFMPHLHKKSDTVMAYLKRNNFTAFDELAMDLAAATLKLRWEQKDNNATTSYQPDDWPSVTEKQETGNEQYPTTSIPNNSSPTSRTMRFLQRLSA